MAKKVTAFALSPDIAAGADGAHIAGLPGVWKHDEAVLPAALGYTLAELEDAIEFLNLPLVKVMVSESSALESFPPPPGHQPSSAVGPRGPLPDEQQPPVPGDDPDPTVLDQTLAVAEDREQQLLEEDEV